MTRITIGTLLFSFSSIIDLKVGIPKGLIILLSSIAPRNFLHYLGFILLDWLQFNLICTFSSSLARKSLCRSAYATPDQERFRFFCKDKTMNNNSKKSFQLKLQEFLGESMKRMTFIENTTNKCLLR